MNHFTYDELSVGQTAEFSRIISSEMMEQFLSLSSDENPLHAERSMRRKKASLAE